MKFTFDPKLGTMVPKKNDYRDGVSPINMLPQRSCYIYLLMNENPNSVGNTRAKEKVWYNAVRREISMDKQTAGTPIRMYKMKAGVYPKFWMYV